MTTLTGNDKLKNDRLDLLAQFAGKMIASAHRAMFSKSPIMITRVVQIPGPRTGIIDMYAGFGNGTLLSGLESDDKALLRQLLWDDALGDPQVYLSGKAVRIEAGWPTGLSTQDIRLNELHQLKPFPGRFVLGQNIMGQTVTILLDNEKPHGVIAGTTGSGKSVTLRSMVYQLSRNKDRLILIDGKHGDGLVDLDRLPGVIGPLALSADEAQRAMMFAAVQMVKRYSSRNIPDWKIIVVIDEVQEFAQDPVFVELLRKLTSQGRAAGVHVVFATQHPTNDVLGDATIKRNTTLRIGLKVTDQIASRVVMGDSGPRIDKLLGQGDGWSQTPRALHRVQVAQLDPKILNQALQSKPELTTWPEMVSLLKMAPDLIDLEILSKGGTATRAIQFSGRQIALAVVSMGKGETRADLLRQLDEADISVSRKTSSRLWEIASEILETFGQQNLDLRLRRGKVVAHENK